MQNDEVIWQIINHGFCSFKSKVARERTFCQNPYNVTGLCLRSACPLANSQYATIREEDGVCYLFMKTIERAHTPKNLWEKIRLPANYTKALELVSKQLEYFPKYLQHRNKQRLTKIHQMLIRMRKLRLKAGPKIETINTKVEQREKGREKKALKAAQLDRAIEKELLERLQQVTDGEIYNYPERSFSKVLNKASVKFREQEGEEEEDPDAEYEDEEEAEEGEGVEYEEEEEEDGEGEDYNVEYIEDFEESDDEEDIEDAGSFTGSTSSSGFKAIGKPSSSSSFYSASAGKRKHGHEDDDDSAAVGGKKAKKDNSKKDSNKKKGKKGTRVEIEYEDEREEEPVMKARVRESAGGGDLDYNF